LFCHISEGGHSAVKLLCLVLRLVEKELASVETIVMYSPCPKTYKLAFLKIAKADNIQSAANKNDLKLFPQYVNSVLIDLEDIERLDQLGCYPVCKRTG